MSAPIGSGDALAYRVRLVWAADATPHGRAVEPFVCIRYGADDDEVRSLVAEDYPGWRIEALTRAPEAD